MQDACHNESIVGYDLAHRELAVSLPVAQWLDQIERPTGVPEDIGSIPFGDSDFFFVPRS